jgi:hypothetical protein
MARRSLDDVVPPRSCEVRVVEDDLARAGGERLVEGADEAAECAPALVAIETQISPFHVRVRNAGLARALDAHHDHDVSGSASPPRRCRADAEALAVGRVELERGGACG